MMSDAPATGFPTASSAAASLPTAAPRGKGRRYFTVMAAIIALVVFAGFAPTFYLRPLFEQKKALTPIVIAHGLLFTIWIALLFVQVRLVAARRTDVHRKLGVVGGVLVALMAVVGLSAAIASAKHGFTPPGGPPPLVFLVIPFTDVVLFSTIVGLALANRRRPEVHKRMMLLATLAIMTPAFARISFRLGIGFPWPLVDTVLLVVGALVADRIRTGRFHSVFVWGALVVGLSMPARFLLAKTPAWLSFASWLTR